MQGAVYDTPAINMSVVSEDDFLLQMLTSFDVQFAPLAFAFS